MMKKIIVAPDSFKECLTSREVAHVLTDAVQARFPAAQVIPIPLADGGEGTLEVLATALSATIEQTTVHDPLGRPIRAGYGVWGNTALIEVAQVCGIHLVEPHERNPFKTDTRGVGEIVLAAYKKGCRRFIVGLGGTVTCDGGRGMLSIPGVQELLRDSHVELLCDVQVPLTGPNGAIYLFGPQKGATPADVEILESDMLQWTSKIQEETGVEVKDRPGAGAAGGLGAAFMAYARPTVYSGVQYILDLCRFDQVLEGASLVITGEGRSDRQTLQGKAPLGVLQRASGIPVALLSGRLDDVPALEAAGFDWLIEVSPRSLPLHEALIPVTARQNLRNAIRKIDLI